MALSALFVLLNIMLKTIDVQAIGPQNSVIGLATVNNFFRHLIGVNENFYNLSELLGLLPIIMVCGFGVLGIVQMIKRKSLKKVDLDLIILGVFYVIVICVYVFFELFIINYRPILIDGELEASFPSSHVLLAVCVISTTIIQLNYRIKNKFLKIFINILLYFVLTVSVIMRCLSGVHWFTDILGGYIISIALVLFYNVVIEYIQKKKK